MKVECINDNWYMDPETGKAGLTFKRGKIYKTVAPKASRSELVGDVIVINEQGRRHIIRTSRSLGDFFNRYFREITQ